MEQNVEQAGVRPLTECMGGGPTHRALGLEIAERGIAMATPARVDDAVETLADALAHYGPRSCVDGYDLGLVERLLRLATSLACSGYP